MVSSSACSLVDLLPMGFVGLLPSELLLPTVAAARDDRCRAGPVVLDLIGGGDDENAQTSTQKKHATTTRPKKLIKEAAVFIMVKKTDYDVGGGEDKYYDTTVGTRSTEVFWQHCVGHCRLVALCSWLCRAAGTLMANGCGGDIWRI